MDNPSTAGAVRALSVWFDRLFAAIDGLGAAVTGDLEALLDGGAPVTVDRTTSARLRARAASLLDSVPAADGAGVVLAPELLRSDTAELQWWRRCARDDDASAVRTGAGSTSGADPGDGLERTEFDLDPASDRFYDYAALDWFTGPYGHGARTVAGPYIDYLGIDYYICTVSAPVRAHGRVVGIVGCDIRMQDLERALLPLMRDLPGAALLGRTRQVLVGNTGRLSTGVLVAAVPPGFRTVPLAAGAAGLELLYRAG